ncbi:MAG: hypothetical protein ACRYE8_00695 [Janthinobacterium lividum]
MFLFYMVYVLPWLGSLSLCHPVDKPRDDIEGVFQSMRVTPPRDDIKSVFQSTQITPPRHDT